MNVGQQIVARKYAQAYMLASGAQLTEETIQKICAYLDLYTSYTRKFLYIDFATCAVELKIDAFLNVFDQFGLRDTLKNLVSLLARSGRLSLMLPVLVEIVALYQQKHALMDVVVATAHPLSTQQQAIIENFLHKKTGKKIILHVTIDPSLIAGIRLQSDTMVWEHSIAQQLRSFAAQAGNLSRCDRRSKGSSWK
jgi:ATP synthase F1 delta subunit